MLQGRDIFVARAKSPPPSFFTFLLVIVAIFIVELALMFLVAHIHPIPLHIEPFLDAGLLVLVVSPVLYYFIYRSFVVYIGEKEKVEAALKESAERFRYLYERVPLAYQSLDERGVFLEVNTAFLSLFGYARAEVVGRPITDFMTPEGRRGFYGHFSQMLKEGEIRDVELELKKMDGSIVTVLTNGKVTCDVQGKFKETHCILVDITQRKKADEELRSAREYTRSIIDSSLDMIISVDRDRKVVEFNRAAEKTFGYASEEVMGGDVDILYANPDEASKSVEGVQATGLFFGEVVNRRKNGEEFTSYLSSTFLKDERGNVLGTMGISRDISERKRIEQRFRESHQRLITVLESLDTLVWVTDMDTHEMLYANRLLVDIFGEALGKKCWEVLCLKRDGPCDFCKNSDLVDADGTPKAVHVWEMENDINGRCYENRARAIHWVDGRVVRLEIATDITERKEAQAKLLQSKEEAEEATRLKDKFVSLVSHDLMAPLATMLTYLKMVRDDDAEPPNEGQIAILDAAVSSGRNMVNLIDTLLNISRLKTGKMVPRHRFINASFMVMKAMVNFRQLAEQKGLAMTNDVPKSLRLYVDPDLFYEVIQNLLTNAIKFSNAGGTITFFTPEGERSTVAVRDTGIGIEPERQGMLFEYETKTTTEGTAHEQGSGLGLPLSHDIITAHGGRLYVESSPGEGSTFYAQVPYAQPVIMIVEDDKKDREAIRKTIEEVDARIVLAANGQEALRVLEEEHPHLILLDLIMPVMDGFAFLELVKADRAWREIPVIALTVHGERENRNRAFELGVSDFVTKPVSSEELVPRINLHLGG